jgi:hypothetical protein
LKNLILTILSFLFISTASACSCSWGGSFLDLCVDADVVAKIKILGYEDYYESVFHEEGGVPLTLVAEAISIYKGKIVSTELRFSGDGGISCLKYVDQFKIGKEYFIHYSYESFGDHPGLGVCGEFDVEINGNKTVEKYGLSIWEPHTWETDVSTFEADILYALNQCANESFLPEDNIEPHPQKQTCEPEFRLIRYLLYLGVVIVFIFVYFRFRKKKQKPTNKS